MSKIEWTDETWNPIAGCSIVSPGCTNCYAMTMAARIARMNPDLEHYRGLTQPSKAGPAWTSKVALAPETTLLKPLSWRRPRRVFVNSMSDLFHDSVPFDWIVQTFAVMALTPQHDYQVLTKRSARMREVLSSGEMGGIVATAARVNAIRQGVPLPDIKWPLPNVWLGVSCERQQEADARIPDLLATPAAVRYVFAEPLLGPITFRVIEPDANTTINAIDGHTSYMAENYRERSPRLDWIIVGGESGANARPMHPDWARAIRDQCTSAGADAGGHPKRPGERVAFFFKQWGEYEPTETPPQLVHITANGVILRADGQTASGPRYDGGTFMRRVGKTRAGRLLDGREWNEYPQRGCGSAPEEQRESEAAT